jgi:hypothetical protein
MYEELMSQFGIPASEIDTADVHKGKHFILSIKPKGLWIIGANGRIDILTTKGSYMLVDTADEFSKPQWKLLNGNKKNGCNRKPNDRCNGRIRFFKPNMICNVQCPDNDAING